MEGLGWKMQHLRSRTQLYYAGLDCQGPLTSSKAWASNLFTVPDLQCLSQFTLRKRYHGLGGFNHRHLFFIV